MKDNLGDRMKDIEGRTRYFLPRRCYTLIRLDGKSFHTYTQDLNRPFDEGFRADMQETMLLLCSEIQGAKLGYTQSDEISLVLTDFDSIYTDAWFDGNIQKIVSVTASMASAYFNDLRAKRGTQKRLAIFDARVWTTSDPWEVYNTFLWRQQDCTKNAIQMVARSLVSHEECTNKNFAELNELIYQRGVNFNDYPSDCKRGAFSYRTEINGWIIDNNPPILPQNKQYLFSKIPLIPQVSAIEKEELYVGY